ncbi:hypothetical protein WJX72_012434 [[Myrmecia] bisecta]|uniref:mannan endo-1,4-beta-mannosidase n=1 Tax=[Myrmecia] bisecta TaxID=41462 RepID=A0AAW1Q7G7_9CHLO
MTGEGQQAAAQTPKLQPRGRHATSSDPCIQIYTNFHTLKKGVPSSGAAEIARSPIQEMPDAQKARWGQPGVTSYRCKPIQPYVGRYDESALKRLDLILAEAGKNGIRIIAAGANFEDDFGGWKWYVDNILGGGDKEWFLTDWRVKQAYKNYLTMLIWRTNTITGVRYRDDPTILAWECSNEPHTTDLYEKNRGWTPGQLVYNWLSEMSAFIRSQDPNHLIATGEEGYRADGPTDCCHNNWINGGWKGVDFVRNCGLSNIGFCTVHVYPDNWGIASWESSWVEAWMIHDHAKIAHGHNKPIIMEEYGMKVGYKGCRDDLLWPMQSEANKNNYAGWGQPGVTSYRCKPIQPYVGRYDESALKRLDLILAEAGKNGIRIIAAGVNFEDDFGGWKWYVDNILGGGDKEGFLTDSRVKQAYKNYLTMLIWRTNTITGIRYRDDPTILAWECSNEPHTTDLYEKSRGWTPGQLVYNWLSEMSAFIRSQDPSHLISTGEEGYRADGPTDCCHNNWINGGLKGVDYKKNCALPNIGFCTIHVYPDNWGVAAWESSWVNANVIGDRAKIAHGYNKPIIMEEYGMKYGYKGCRDDLLWPMQSAANDNNFAGTLVWQVGAKFVDQYNGQYDFGYGQCGTNAVTAQNWRNQGMA